MKDVSIIYNWGSLKNMYYVIFSSVEIHSRCKFNAWKFYFLILRD